MRLAVLLLHPKLALSIKLLLNAGMIAWGIVVTLSNSWADVDDNDTGIDPYFGIGIEFDLTRVLALRLQHEKFFVDTDSDIFIVVIISLCQYY